MRVEVGLAAGVDEGVLELLAEPAGGLVLLALLPHHPIYPPPTMSADLPIRTRTQRQPANFAAGAYSTPFPFMLEHRLHLALLER